jgi:hypothetical protein
MKTQRDVRLEPVCYMIMPFRRKKVDEPRPTGAPAEIDFDALWEKAYWPALEELGYLPMRADFDPSSAIVKAMLERIAFADLVIADVTLGNGNVYYEVGIRHVAKETNCLLVAADWCKPLFDIAQFASIRFPLTNGDIDPAEAETIHKLIVASVPKLKNSRTPYHELLLESKTDSARRAAFRDFAERLNNFQAAVKAVRLERDPERRKARLSTVRSELQPSALEIPEVALDLMVLVRDILGWKELQEFIETLPENIRAMPLVREQRLLAVAESGDPMASIAGLRQLIDEQGGSPERYGIIGGRWKRLWRNARSARLNENKAEPSLDEIDYLTRAIESYERGMQLDYNEYYCSCNLPPLLKARGEEGDLERATVVEHFVVAACQRALDLGKGDEYLRPTLLGAAFRAGDVKQAEKIARTVKMEGHQGWKLKATLADLSENIGQQPDAQKRAMLQRIHDDLAALLPQEKAADA